MGKSKAIQKGVSTVECSKCGTRKAPIRRFPYSRKKVYFCRKCWNSEMKYRRKHGLLTTKFPTPQTARRVYQRFRYARSKVKPRPKSIARALRRDVKTKSKTYHYRRPRKVDTTKSDTRGLDRTKAYPKKKWGKIGSPHSKKRKQWLAKIRKKRKK